MVGKHNYYFSIGLVCISLLIGFLFALAIFRSDAFSPSPLPISDSITLSVVPGLLQSRATRIISPLLRLSTFRPEDPSTTGRWLIAKHPDYDVVIDVGVHSGLDYTIPAYKLGYTVFAFELVNWGQFINSSAHHGLREGDNYTIVRVTPGSVPKIDTRRRPHIYYFQAGASDKNVAASVRGLQDMAQSLQNTSGELALVRLDDVVSLDEKVLILKTDTQGHEPLVFAGAKKLLASRRIPIVQLEFWPQGMKANGLDAYEMLTFLYDLGYQCFDVGLGFTPVGRPSDLRGYIKALVDVPMAVSFNIGAWDDLTCTPNTAAL
jgi:hypothetical protein